MPRPDRPMKRRRFVQLVALGGAAVLTNSLGRAEETRTRRPGAQTRASRKDAAHRLPTAAMAKEIANQEKLLAEQIATIRKFDLPPGSPLAFVFTPLRPNRRR